MEHFVFTDNVKLALTILYSVIFALMAIVKVIALATKKDMENMWVRLKSFFFNIKFTSI